MSEKVREARLRRQLDRMGYALMKSRARDPRDLTYGGYQIVDHQTSGVVAGYAPHQRGFDLTLEEVEDWIAEAPTTKAA